MKIFKCLTMSLLVLMIAASCSDDKVTNNSATDRPLIPDIQAAKNMAVPPKLFYEEIGCGDRQRKIMNKYGDRIAIMGGIDMDFLTRKRPEEVYSRAIKLLEQTSDRGGFALGSGNSIAHYVPMENYLSMIRAATDFAPSGF